MVWVPAWFRKRALAIVVVLQILLGALIVPASADIFGQPSGGTLGIDAQLESLGSGLNQFSTMPLGEPPIAPATGRTGGAPGSAASPPTTASVQPIRLFVPEKSGDALGKAQAICKNPSTSGPPYNFTIICPGVPETVDPNRSTSSSTPNTNYNPELALGTACELATGGLIAAVGTGANVPSVVCTDFIDPIPESNLARIPGSSCVVLNRVLAEKRETEVLVAVSEATAGGTKLCNAVLTATGNIGLLSASAFFFVDTIQNILIGLAIIAVVIVGIIMMFSSGNEESMKKAKAMMYRILAGLALLLILKILLVTVNPAGFAMNVVQYVTF